MKVKVKVKIEEAENIRVHYHSALVECSDIGAFISKLQNVEWFPICNIILFIFNIDWLALSVTLKPPVNCFFCMLCTVWLMCELCKRVKWSTV